ncbi:MAG: hypothetical protein ACYDH9_11400 [Limisphaerales bacterium]
MLHHWFGRDHLIGAAGLQIPFRYYFCQREAIETLVYLYEVRGIRSLTSVEMSPCQLNGTVRFQRCREAAAQCGEAFINESERADLIGRNEKREG